MKRFLREYRKSKSSWNQNSRGAIVLGASGSVYTYSHCQARWSFISPPENDSFRKDLCFTRDVFFLPREISEMRGPTGVKFCTMVTTRHYFIIPVQNFGGHTPKNFRGEKHAKFGPISDDFEVRRRISPKRIKIFKFGFLFRLQRFLLR